MRPANPVSVLVPFVVALGFAVIGSLAVAVVVRFAMRRLGLELSRVLLWFGLAEAATDDLPVRRSGRVVRLADHANGRPRVPISARSMQRG